MTFDEKLPRYIDSICRALTIKNDQELNQLMILFDKHNLNSQEEIKISEESLQIDPDIVLDLLKEFYLEKKNKAKEQCKKLFYIYFFLDFKFFKFKNIKL